MTEQQWNSTSTANGAPKGTDLRRLLTKSLHEQALRATQDELEKAVDRGPRRRIGKSCRQGALFAIRARRLPGGQDARRQT